MTEDTWKPSTVPAHFPGLGMCFYESGPKRPPLAGEYFSARGRPIQRASGAHQWPQRIMRPTCRAVPLRVTITRYQRGEPIT